jgi:HK97 family phage major capsid protein
MNMAREAFGEGNLATTLEAQIGQMAKAVVDITDEMVKAKDTDTERWNELALERARQAEALTALKADLDKRNRDSETEAAVENARAINEYAAKLREPSKAREIGGYPKAVPTFDTNTKGAFLYGVHEANARDSERQAEGKAILAALRNEEFNAKAVFQPEGKAVLDAIQGARRPDAKAYSFEEAWGKSTLGATDATGGWIIPNAIVDEFITPGQVDNIYRSICTVVPGVTAFAVDIPFRSAARTRAAIAAFGATKENVDLAYNGYTATMYTLARIYDIGNQFLRQSRGAAEQDVLSELAAAFAQGEAYYIREGSGSSQPFGYTSALTNGPAAFRTTFSPSATTLAGSIAVAIATDAGVLAGRGAAGRSGQGLAAVLSASSYWTMLAQGTDTAGFFFNPAAGPTAINVPAGTLISPFGIPVYPDADADLEGTAAVIDNLVVGNWKKFKVYFGESYRVDSSDQAGTRWDTNLTGFRGEEEMGFDARPAVYAGYFQMNTDIVP